MNLFELSRKSLIVMLLSLMALACSSTEEAPPPADTGVPCDLDMMQPGCTKEDVDL